MGLHIFLWFNVVAELFNSSLLKKFNRKVLNLISPDFFKIKPLNKLIERIAI
jgi:hypothetical protein